MKESESEVLCTDCTVLRPGVGFFVVVAAAVVDIAMSTLFHHCPIFIFYSSTGGTI
jgi:hypothetical protein